MRAATVLLTLAIIADALVPSLAFDCAEKKCSEMESCAEAYYHLEVCGHTVRDADGDTIPCENVCSGNIDEYHRRRGPPLSNTSPVRSPTLPKRDAAPPDTSSAFTCAGKRKCSEMQSCAEARFYLSTCGVASLDRDKDGVPCESLCGGR